MKAYILNAALWCETCAQEFMRETERPAHVVELAPGDYDESSYDSDEWPKGPYPNGGGEADCPQHCDGCALFLENPLTPEGDAYVRQAAKEFETAPDMTWPEIADAADTGGKPALAAWIRYYFAGGL